LAERGREALRAARFRCARAAISLVFAATNRDSWEDPMKAFLASVVVLVVIAVGANFVLNGIQKPAESAYTSPTGARPN
jgi:hypothetical protein